MLYSPANPKNINLRNSYLCSPREVYKILYKKICKISGKIQLPIEKRMNKVQYIHTIVDSREKEPQPHKEHGWIVEIRVLEHWI